jgi:hypothetical protein
MGNQNCCGTKIGAKNKLRTPLQPGKSPHRKRKAFLQSDPKVYNDLPKMASLAATDEEAFIKLIRQNQITDLTKYKGFNYAEKFFMLESGRQITTTEEWNAFTFALVLNKPSIIEYVLKHCERLDEHLAIGLQKNESNMKLWLEDQQVCAQLETLCLLAEHQSPNFELVLNKLHFLMTSSIFEKLVPRVARLKNGPWCLVKVFESLGFRQLFYKNVCSSGLISAKNSF